MPDSSPPPFVSGGKLYTVTFDPDGISLDFDMEVLRIEGTFTVARPGEELGLSLDVGTSQGRVMSAEALVTAIGDYVDQVEREDTGALHLRLAGGTELWVHP